MEINSNNLLSAVIIETFIKHLLYSVVRLRSVMSVECSLSFSFPIALLSKTLSVLPFLKKQGEEGRAGGGRPAASD